MSQPPSWDQGQPPTWGASRLLAIGGTSPRLGHQRAGAGTAAPGSAASWPSGDQPPSWPSAGQQPPPSWPAAG